MRNLLALVFLCSAAVGLALLLGSNSASVSVFWHPWRLDVSLNLALLALCVLGVLLYVVWRGVVALRELPLQAQRWRERKHEQALYTALLDAVVLQLAGRYGRAQTCSRKALDLLDTLPAQPRWRVLAQLLLAESARSLGQREARQTALQAALSERDAAATEAQEGVALRATVWALEERDAKAAQHSLAQLPQGASRRIAAARLRLRLAQLKNDTRSAIETVRLLLKHRAMSASVAQSLLQSLFKEALKQASDRDQLAQIWGGLTAHERNSPALLLHAVECWQALPAGVAESNESQSSETARPAFEQQTLSVLWAVYGELPEGLRLRAVRCFEVGLPAWGRAWLPQLEQAQRTWPADAPMQYLVGQAWLHCQLWGKAQVQLSAAARQLSDAACLRRAWRALAQLAEQRGDAASAALAWRRAAEVD